MAAPHTDLATPHRRAERDLSALLVVGVVVTGIMSWSLLAGARGSMWASEAGWIVMTVGGMICMLAGYLLIRYPTRVGWLSRRTSHPKGHGVWLIGYGFLFALMTADSLFDLVPLAVIVALVSTWLLAGVCIFMYPSAGEDT